ncbi:DUF2059 domain-containing protein [Undibacterium sp. CY18W]|uniref:DUF2059 domain-containing protein n=1 Tax=Undibacterium hunanense TaxID=2762292 RepID=A0ABR6ZKU9_9BURK|nr:DUF2059 domain-containing protein [Undibacterium hunanense]MBC3916498.1 DUF2059 domain-containing protein [Undibacterium hunanense]
MKLWSKLLLSALLVCGSAHAEKPTDASLKELLVVTNSQQILKAVEAQVDGLMKNVLEQTTKDRPLNAESQKALDKFRDKVRIIHKEQFGWDKLEPLFIDIYSKSLTQEDVDGIIAFYKSPAGKSYVSKMPAMMQQSMASMQKLMGPMMEKIIQAGKELDEDMGKANKK